MRVGDIQRLAQVSRRRSYVGFHQNRGIEAIQRLDLQEAYLTVSYLDDAPEAAFVGVCSGATVHLALLMHSPRFARHSPGIHPASCNC